MTKLPVYQLMMGKANALNPNLFEALGKALNKAEKGKAKLVVIAGRTNIFSAGLDLKLLPTLSAEGKKECLALFAHTMCRLFMLPIPTVAAITGYAIAGGAIMAYACDKRIFLTGGSYRLARSYRQFLSILPRALTFQRFQVSVFRCQDLAPLFPDTRNLTPET